MDQLFGGELFWLKRNRSCNICYLEHTSQPVDLFTFLNRAMDAKFGFSSFAETWNGRLAMMGFVIGLGTELLTGQGILSQIGIG